MPEGATPPVQHGRGGYGPAPHGARPPSEASLVAAARAGDLAAWSHLILWHQETIFRSAYLVTRDSADAETIARSTFARGFRSLNSLTPGATLRPWLIGIATNTARTRKRDLSRRHDGRLPEPDPCPRLAASPMAIPRGTPRPAPHEREALEDAFAALTDDDRLLIAARYAFGLSREDGATSLGIGSAQIEERLRQAMARLRSRLLEVMSTNARATGPDVLGTAQPQLHAGHIGLLEDDRLGPMVMAVVLSELSWTPDVRDKVCSQLAREAVAYPTPLGAGTTDEGVGSPSDRSLRSVERRLATGSGGVPMKRAAFVVFLALVSLAVASERIDVTEWSFAGAQSPSSDLPMGTLDDASVAADPAAPAPVVADPVVAIEPVSDGPRLPDIAVAGAWTLANGAIGARVGFEWSTPDLGPVVRSHLERGVGRKGWRIIQSAEADGQLVTRLKRGVRYRFRVRVEDASGSVATSPVMRADLIVRGPRSMRLTAPAREWVIREGVFIKRRLIATVPGARLSTAFSGHQVALVGPAGPTRAPVAVRVDGGPWLVRDVDTWPRAERQVVFSQELEGEMHSLDVQAQDIEAAVDAVLIVRSRELT